MEMDRHKIIDVKVIKDKCEEGQTRKGIECVDVRLKLIILIQTKNKKYSIDAKLK